MLVSFLKKDTNMKIYVCTHQAEEKYVPLSVMHQQQQQQHNEDRPVERPQVTQSKCNVIVAINLIPKLNEEQGKIWQHSL